MSKIKRRTPPKKKLKRRPKTKKNQSQIQKLYDYLVDRSNKLWWFSSHINASCLKCAAVNKEMIRTGCLMFCVSCFSEEFDPKSEERNKEVYEKWYKIQDKVCEEELK